MYVVNNKYSVIVQSAAIDNINLDIMAKICDRFEVTQQRFELLIDKHRCTYLMTKSTC